MFLAGLFQVSIKESSGFAKKSANCPPRIGAIPAKSQLTTLVAARYDVAWPFGDSFNPKFPDANDTPAVAIPMKICMMIKRGIVPVCFSGSVVKVHANIQAMNKGPQMANTDLLLK